MIKFDYAKSHAKIDILKFKTKIVSFEYFSVGIWKILLSYLKSTSSNSDDHNSNVLLL